jgi:hypothetical protein
MDRVAMIDMLKDALKGLDEEPLKRLQTIFNSSWAAKKKFWL